MYFITQLINGLQTGSIYALIALGYTMVYGIVKLINFAHGDLMMVASYLLLFMISSWGLPFPVAILLAMVFTAILGMLIEAVAYRPLRHSSRLSALISAIGVSLLLQNLMMLIFKPTPRRFPDLFGDLPRIHLGDTSFSPVALASIVSAVLIMLILQGFVTRTRTGKAMRAVSEDMKAAQLMGINVNRIIAMTFAIGSSLAAFAAFLFIIAYPQVDPYLGAMPGIKAFIAAVLGGIGILPGAMIGGFILGIIESLTRAFMPSGYSQLADAAVFAVLILVLLFKPAGLLGKPTREKV